MVSPNEKDCGKRENVVPEPSCMSPSFWCAHMPEHLLPGSDTVTDSFQNSADSDAFS